MKKFLKKSIGIVALIALTMVSFTGCMTAIKHGNIVSITQAGVGIDLESVSTGSGSPAVKMGFFRTTVNLVPTAQSTNGAVTIVSPNVADTAFVDQNGKALTIGGSETLAVGNFKTGNPAAQNPVLAEPALPK